MVDGQGEIVLTAGVEAGTRRAQMLGLSDAMAVMRLKEEQDVEKEPQQKQEEDEFDEEAFLLEGASDTIVCPISMVLMRDACVAGDGFSFNRPALQAWVERCKAKGQVLRSPKTGEPMPEITLPNQNIRTHVVEWIEEKHKQRRAMLAVAAVAAAAAAAAAAVGSLGAKGGAGDGTGASKKKNKGRTKGTK